MVSNKLAEFAFGVGRPFFLKKTLNFLLFLSVAIVLVALLFAKKYYGIRISNIFFHALEGALVGGACDWFAIGKMYKKIEVNKKNIAKEIGGWVKNEIINSREIRNRLHELARDEGVKDKVYLWLDKLLGDERQASDLLTSIWKKHIRQFVHDKIVNYELSKDDVAVISGAVGDGSVEKVFTYCFGKALVAISKKSEVIDFRDAVLNGLAVNFVTQKFVKWYVDPVFIEGLGKKLIGGELGALSSSSPIKVGLDACLKIAYPEYVSSWNGLPGNIKRQCVDNFFDNLERAVIDVLAQELCSQRNKLRNFDKLIEWDAVDRSIKAAEEFLNDDLSDYVGSSVAESLNNLEDKEFRNSLEDNTRAHLESIRVVGTCMGFVFGAGLGWVIMRFFS